MSEQATALGGGNEQGGNNAQDSGNNGSAVNNAGVAASGAASAGVTGSSQKSWRDSLPEDIKNNPSISSFKDVEALTRSLIHAQSLVGKKGVILPGEKATDEDWQSFYKQLGVPEAEKYELSAPKDHEFEDGVIEQFKEQAVKNGLLPKQAAAVLDWYSQFEKTTLEAQEKELGEIAKEQMDGLRKEWGEGFDKEINTARFAVKEVGGEEFVKYLDETGMGNDVNLIRFAAKVGKLLGEDKLREGGVSSSASSKQEAQAALDELRANGNTNGLYDKSHPMHNVTMSKLESLAKQLTGGR